MSMAEDDFFIYIVVLVGIAGHERKKAPPKTGALNCVWHGVKDAVRTSCSSYLRSRIRRCRNCRSRSRSYHRWAGWNPR